MDLLLTENSQFELQTNDSLLERVYVANENFIRRFSKNDDFKVKILKVNLFNNVRKIMSVVV